MRDLPAAPYSFALHDSIYHALKLRHYSLKIKGIAVTQDARAIEAAMCRGYPALATAVFAAVLIHLEYMGTDGISLRGRMEDGRVILDWEAFGGEEGCVHAARAPGLLDNLDTANACLATGDGRISATSNGYCIRFQVAAE